MAATAGSGSWWAGLVDDAAIFPPGEAPLPEAVSAYLSRRSEPWVGLVGPLVVADRVLPDLPGLVAGVQPRLPVSVVCSGGAGSLEPAARWASELDDVDLHALELALRDLDDLTGSAQRVTRAAEALASSAGLEVPLHVEVPPLPPDGRADPAWLGALDELAATDLRLKFRCGGPDPSAVPSPVALARQIDAALDRELAFKCTAGLHHAVRRADPSTGRTEHGFLNVLLATRASLDGEPAEQVLQEADPAVVVERVRELGDEPLARTRRWFTSFGCCGVEDPYRDLTELGLLP